jgi:hypothetical protein
MKSSVSLKHVSDIINLSEPSIQRNLNKKHIQEIIEDQKLEYKKWQCFSILQTITIANVRNDKSYILDGNHRIRVFRELHKLGYPIYDLIVPVVEYDIFDITDLVHYYNMINKNMPIHPLELQEDFSSYGKVIIENIIKDFGVYIKDDHKNSKCPHINMNEFKKNIAGRSLGEKLGKNGFSATTFWNHIIEFNEYVRKTIKPANQLCSEMKKRIISCENKAENFKSPNVCYLGIWRKFEWLDICLVSLIENKNFADINLACDKNMRTRIPYTIREQVWKKINTNLSDIGECFTCNKDLYFCDMECGHIKAHALGGSNNIDNLMPICKKCNVDMGIMDLLSYRDMIEKMSN